MAQQKYASTDVLYLHELRIKLNGILKREKRIEIAQACFNFIEHRVKLDLSGWPDLDIFKTLVMNKNKRQMILKKFYQLK